MSVPQLQYLNAQTGQLEVEPIYGEAPLRFMYSNPLGAGLRELFFKRSFFSKLYGAWASSSISASTVPQFIKRYGIKMADFVEPQGGFKSFNAFFTRKLAKNARPIDPNPKVLVFPADARHFVIPTIKQGQVFNVKGDTFDLATFLGDAALSKRYEGGSLLISRLCPIDYHRFHTPCNGTLGTSRIIKGPLYSVNPLALAKRPSIFWENQRVITPLETQNFGLIQYVEVGATCVGKIVQTARPGPVQKGQEKGYFAFGGSTVVLLMEPGKATFSQSLLEASSKGLETLAQVGTPLA